MASTIRRTSKTNARPGKVLRLLQGMGDNANKMVTGVVSEGSVMRVVETQNLASLQVGLPIRCRLNRHGNSWIIDTMQEVPLEVHGTYVL